MTFFIPDCLPCIYELFGLFDRTFYPVQSSSKGHNWGRKGGVQWRVPSLYWCRWQVENYIHMFITLSIYVYVAFVLIGFLQIWLGNSD